MMPKISVRPAASRKSSMPSCTPLRHCSMKYNTLLPHPEVLGALAPSLEGHSISARPISVGTSAGILRPTLQAPCLFHWALSVIRVLVVLDDRREGVQRVAAIVILPRFLKVEILDGQVIVAELEAAAHRLEIGLFHLLAHAFLVAQVAVHGGDRVVEQCHGVVGIRPIE